MVNLPKMNVCQLGRDSTRENHVGTLGTISGLSEEKVRGLKTEMFSPTRVCSHLDNSSTRKSCPFIYWRAYNALTAALPVLPMRKRVKNVALSCQFIRCLRWAPFRPQDVGELRHYLLSSGLQRCQLVKASASEEGCTVFKNPDASACR